jgi:outer membrane protein OmpA-like peptidoglycan-associated protein
MQIRMFLLASMIGLVGTAHASDRPSREEGIGLMSGAASGALIGGPPGAIIGLALGAFVGDRINVANQAESKASDLENQTAALEARTAELETRLARADSALADARVALERARADAREGDADFLAELAARLSADVLFRTGSAELAPDVEDRVRRLGDALIPLADIAIELHGFADPRGDEEFNRALSEQRAERVRDLLVESGLEAARVSVFAHGEALSTAPTGDADAYAWERRVTLGLIDGREGRVARID